MLYLMSRNLSPYRLRLDGIPAVVDDDRAILISGCDGGDATAPRSLLSTIVHKILKMSIMSAILKIIWIVPAVI